jgi:rubrerythrin
MRVPELSRVEVEGMTRSAFILRGALAAGAAYGVGAVGPFVADAFGATAVKDVKVLEFALSLEQLEAAFYKAALANAGLSGNVKKLATLFGAHEAEHVQVLNGLLTQLGAKPPAPVQAKFGLTDQASFLKLAVALEDTGVGAYNGAAPAIQTPDLVAALGSVVQVEARHSAALRTLAGQDPAPQAFEKPLAAADVTARVQPFVGP